MKSLTAQEIARKHNKVIARANEWLSKGYSLETIATGIWNNFGYSTEVKNNKVNIYGRNQSGTYIIASIG